jgi:hypothetical protein
VTMPDPSLTGPAKTNYLGETGATIAPKRRTARLRSGTAAAGATPAQARSAAPVTARLTHLIMARWMTCAAPCT